MIYLRFFNVSIYHYLLSDLYEITDKEPQRKSINISKGLKEDTNKFMNEFEEVVNNFQRELLKAKWDNDALVIYENRI